MQTPRRRRRASLVALLTLCVAIGPGCLIGSPLAAFSGEPYGMVIDDVGALRGRNGKIWSDAPVFAFFDLPVAFALDTAFLPISLIMWGLLSIGESDDDDGEEWEEDAEYDEGTGGDVYRDDSGAARDRYNRRATD